MYVPHFIPKSLRSSPRRHRGDRITTMPMKTPPLPVELAVSGCTILFRHGPGVIKKERPVSGHSFRSSWSHTQAGMAAASLYRRR